MRTEKAITESGGGARDGRIGDGRDHTRHCAERRARGHSNK